MTTAKIKENYNDQHTAIKQAEIDITAGAKNTSSIPELSEQQQSKKLMNSHPSQNNLYTEGENLDDDLINPAIRGI